MTPDPIAKPARSKVVRGIWPGYFGGGRFRTEKCRLGRTAAAGTRNDSLYGVPEDYGMSRTPYNNLHDERRFAEAFAHIEVSG